MKILVRLSIVFAAMLFAVPGEAQTAAAQAAASPSASKGTRLILLGTAGGPSIKKSRAQPANALVVNGSIYIIDAGNGVARQMALANLSPQALRAVFITHLHSDHMADYGTLLLRAWQTGLKNPVDTYGPAPLEDMTQAYMRYMDWDIQLRISDENRPPFAPLVRAHNIAAEGVIYQDANVKVTAVEVPHGGAKPSYAFRFDTPTRSIVFSGDTSRSSSLVRLAKGADILVHEVLNTEGVDAAVGISNTVNDALKRHIIEAHTPIEEVGQVAHDAGVKKLVLTHFVPALPAFDKPEIWIHGARKFFGGEIVVGQDLLEIE
jgi:ribonuclease BN (tRNA processing enzyme)